MNGVAAKIAQEIGVLFQHHYIDSGASEQKAAHHSRGTAAHDAAARVIVSKLDFLAASLRSSFH